MINIILIKHAMFIGISINILKRLENKQIAIRKTRVNNLNNL